MMQVWDLAFFSLLFQIFYCLREKCRCRNRGYSGEISSQHRGLCSRSGCVSSLQGHGSLYCGGGGSVVYSRGPSFCQPVPTSATYSIGGGYRCGGEGSVAITCGDRGETSGWGVAGGTVPIYGAGGRTGGSMEGSDWNTIDSPGGGGSSSYSGRLGIIEGGGSGYGYDVSPRENTITTYGGSDGSGYYSEGLGYGIEGCSGPELSSGGGGSSQAMQQKCPVVVPRIEVQQSKKTSQWPLSQKK